MVARIELSKIKAALRADGMHVWPNDPRSPPDKEYISGFYQVKMGNKEKEKEAFNRRNRAAKLLRAEGFQVWTEPKDHIGGTDTYEFPLSAMRRK